VSDGLASPSVTSLFEDSKGILWIGTEKGLSRYESGKISSYFVSDGLVGNFITAITEDKLGRIWIGTGGGLCYFFNGGFTVLNYSEVDLEIRINSLFHDPDGILWIATEGRGLLSFDGEVLEELNTSFDFSGRYIKSIYKDSKGRLWIGSEEGISFLEENILKRLNLRSDAQWLKVNTINEDIHGDIWFALNGTGLIRYSKGEPTLYLDQRFDLKKIECSLLDQRGDLWFGLSDNGVIRLPADWFEVYSSDAGFQRNMIFAIAADDRNNLYVGFDGSGVSLIQNGKLESPEGINNLNNRSVYSLLYSGDDLWIGTAIGLSRYSGDRVYNYQIEGQVDRINTLLLDSQGILWAGGERGLYNYEKASKALRYFKRDGTDPYKGTVKDLYEDSDGRIWVSTDSDTLLLIEKDRVIISATFRGEEIKFITGVYQDSKSDFWFTTNGFGIIHFSGDSVTRITSSKGLSADICYDVTESNEKLYISTVNGISVLNLREYRDTGGIIFNYINLENGLPSRQLVRGAAVKDMRGSIWFGTAKGIVKISPSRRYYPNPPHVLINKIIASDDEIDTTLSSPEPLNLNHERNIISIHFSATSFASPSRTIFEFSLNDDEKWTTVEEGKVTFRELPSGSYNFKVRARNGDGVWSKEASGFTFEILPPFYSTLLFNFSAVLFLVFILYSFYLYKTDRIQKRNFQLIKLVKERTKELEEEKNKSDGLLLNILPKILVDELKRDGKVKPRAYSNVTILFTDFKDFTNISSVLPAEELVSELNDIFRTFDTIIEKHGLEKLKTSGDAYMAAGGLPIEAEDHAEKAVFAAIEMHHTIKKRNENSSIKWEMRCGIHTGSVIAGVVGSRKFNYDVWGDTVNIASRMESSGSPGEINISESTYQLVRNVFECQHRGKIFAKGKGKLDMFFVKSIIDDEAEEKFNSGLNS
jgi:ligand-binding sensor domain-containing protein